MFMVTRWTNTGNWSISDENRNYLHTDGNVYYRCGEYWPTQELAQAVLDKYQPPHVWEHGDVFRSAAGGWVGVYFCLVGGLPMVFSLDGIYVKHNNDIMIAGLARAKFLFNIKDKL